MRRGPQTTENVCANLLGHCCLRTPNFVKLTAIMIPLPWDGGGDGRRHETLFNEKHEISWKVTEKIIKK